MRIAVTGNIGCGKSTVMRLLREQLPQYVFCNVDEEVAALYEEPAYLAAVLDAFGTDDKTVLSNIVFADAGARKKLEDLAMSFIAPRLTAHLANPDVVMEFPLLFEMGGWSTEFDFIVALGCDDDIQEQRVLARPNMTWEKFARIRAIQLPTAAKMSMADYALDTGCDVEEMPERVKDLVRVVHRWEHLRAQGKDPRAHLVEDDTLHVPRP